MKHVDPLISAELQRFRERLATPEEVSWHIRWILQAIREELFSPSLNVQSLLRRCHTRDHNVSCQFKLETGMSIKHYIESLRLEAARELLVHDRFSAAVVAHAVGYSHLQTFYGAFRRRFECTPGDCRVVREPVCDAAELVP